MLGERRLPRKRAEQGRLVLVREQRCATRAGSEPGSSSHCNQAQKRSIPDMKSSTTVATAETSSEPRQPSRLGKEKEHGGLTVQASVVDQRPNQREQGLVFGSVAVRPKELSDLAHGRSSARAGVRLMLNRRASGARTSRQTSPLPLS